MRPSPLRLAPLLLGVAVLALAPAAAADVPSDWFPLDEGRTWTYRLHKDRVLEGDPGPTLRAFFRGRSVAEVVDRREADGRTVFRLRRTDTAWESSDLGRPGPETRESSDDLLGPADDRMLLYGTSDRTAAAEGTTEYEPPLAMLEAPLRPGRSWRVGTLVRGGLEVEARAEVLGRETVEVGDRSVEDALHVRLSGPVSGTFRSEGQAYEVREGRYALELWLERGVGPVKDVTTTELDLAGPEGDSLRFSQIVTRRLESRDPAYGE